MKATAPLQSSVIILKVYESEKVGFSLMQSLISFVNTWTADDKYSLLNRDYLKQQIRTILS